VLFCLLDFCHSSPLPSPGKAAGKKRSMETLALPHVGFARLLFVPSMVYVVVENAVEKSENKIRRSNFIVELDNYLRILIAKG